MTICTRISLWLGEIPVQYTTTTLDVHTSYYFFKKTNSTSPLLLLLPPNRPSYSSSSLPYCNIRLFSQVADNGARGWGKQNVGYRGRRGIVLGLLRIRGFRLYIQYIGPKEYQENFWGNTYNRSILHFITNLAASEAVGIEY